MDKTKKKTFTYQRKKFRLGHGPCQMIFYDVLSKCYSVVKDSAPEFH